MKVCVYSRYSTDQQDRTSIAGQIANCEALASREGLTIVARYQDEGQSGNDDSRPGYQAMLAALKRGEFVGIVCDETSRITRNQAELHRLVAELRFRDQFLISSDGIDTRSDVSEIVLSVKAAIDQMEGRKIGYRTFRSLRERHRAGYCAGGRIYGYDIVEDGDYKRRVVNDEQAEVVREIFTRFANGESSRAIVRDLNERRVPSPGSYWNNKKRRAVGWVHTTICGAYSKADGILRNPIYAGQATWNKRKGKKKPGTSQRVQTRRPDDEWISFQDESLRIVSDDVWNKVQARLESSRRQNGHRGRPARYILSGILKCASCGGSYVMANDRNYRCSSHTNGRDTLCDQKRTINRQKAENTLLAGIKQDMLAPKFIKAMARRVRSRLRDMEQPDVGKLKREQQNVESQLQNIIDSIASLGGSKALHAKVRELETRKDEIASQMQIQKPPRLIPNVEKSIRSRIETLEQIPRDKYTDPELTDKARAAVRDLLGEVNVIEEGDHVFAEVDLGRVYINHGAQERT